jgi:hypothetical protein
MPTFSYEKIRMRGTILDKKQQINSVGCWYVEWYECLLISDRKVVKQYRNLYGTYSPMKYDIVVNTSSNIIK